MAKELTPSEYEQMVATGKAKKSSGFNYSKLALPAVAIVVLCGLSFAAGMGYQKGHTTTASTNTAALSGAQGNGFGRFGNGQRPTVGQVTAVSSDSITVTNERTGSAQTLKITSSTVVENNGATASGSDIKTGDTVFIQVDSSDSSTASRIELNPSMMQGPPSDSSSTPTTSST